jgi:plastocyanin domain-containing protein
MVIEFTQAKSGDIAFTCGMNMLHSTPDCLFAAASSSAVRG